MKARTSGERFYQYVEKTEGCWLWNGAVVKGYGRFRQDSQRTVFAHRFAYETLVGAIPTGLFIDHLCRVRNCVNPDHMEPVTTAVNLRRGTTFAAINAAKSECPQGHPYDTVNTYTPQRGGRMCRECGRKRSREAQRRRRGKALIAKSE